MSLVEHHDCSRCGTCGLVRAAHLLLGLRDAYRAHVGIRVLGLEGRQLPTARSVLRAVAYVVSIVPLFAGFLWVLVDLERRGWHDHIARSRVVYEPHERGGA